MRLEKRWTTAENFFVCTYPGGAFLWRLGEVRPGNLSLALIGRMDGAMELAVHVKDTSTCKLSVEDGTSLCSGTKIE